MTSELLEANIALSAYGGPTPRGLKVCWSGQVGNVQFIILRNKSKVFVAYAGTNEWADAWRHVWVRRRAVAPDLLVHRGWLSDFERCIPVLYSVLREQCEDLSTTVTFLGHSYGGSLAQLSAWFYAQEIGMPRVDLRTYGSPRVGNKSWARDLDRRVNSHYRFKIKGDPVTQTPLPIRYYHGGTQILLPFHRSPHSMASYLKSITGDHAE